MAEKEALARSKKSQVPVWLIEYIDENVRDVLPNGTRFLGTTPSGASYWARAARIDATDEAEEETPFFLKVYKSENAKDMAYSEFASMKVFYDIMPEMVAEPIGWGAYKNDPDAYFFVCRFEELTGDIPNSGDFPELLAELHKRSESTATNPGEFGYPITSWGGTNPVRYPSSQSWEECFTKCMELTFAMEEETHGPDDEMTRLREGLMTKVIPRLLRPLETEGRTVKPALCHGNLWDGNASVDASTGTPKIFDVNPTWGHNEYDLAPWWCPRHRMTKVYIDEYFRYYQAAEPAVDFKDRGILYSLRFDVHASSIYPGVYRFRKIAMDNMRRLVDKYPDGYEGYAEHTVLGDQAEETEQQQIPKTTVIEAA
ncbi:Protein-ribulosamine 3-kinase, chloroplastic [Cytospora mali]|uniref:protein-ribulosamine 3-kinase n=1 Tax=Cytospora mali TaxID=578113 RepID=A0A194VZ81_CYTMA|nr:Protein-ribulosamine 3-kinase, chloroplastic [Valsa mali]